MVCNHLTNILEQKALWMQQNTSEELALTLSYRTSQRLFQITAGHLQCFILAAASSVN